MFFPSLLHTPKSHERHKITRNVMSTDIFYSWRGSSSWHLQQLQCRPVGVCSRRDVVHDAVICLVHALHGSVRHVVRNCIREQALSKGTRTGVRTRVDGQQPSQRSPPKCTILDHETTYEKSPNEPDRCRAWGSLQRCTASTLGGTRDDGSDRAG